MSEYLDYEGLAHFKDKILSKMNSYGDLEHIYNLIEMLRTQNALITIIITDQDGEPVEGIICTNITDRNENNVVTDKNGKATGFASASNSFKPSFPNYIDIASFSSTAIKTLSATEYEIPVTATTRNFVKITTSGQYYVSSNVDTVDMCLVGGGGSGGSHYTKGGAGGGGGGVTKIENIFLNAKEPYSLSIGSGGAKYLGNWNGTQPNPNETGKNGGDTTFLEYSASGGSGGEYTYYSYPSTHYAIGGSGGTGGGNGGSAYNRETNTGSVDGKNGTIPYYISYTEESQYGPGGGGAGRNIVASDKPSYGKGGSVGGGNGGDIVSAALRNAKDGIDGGGGGGGSAEDTDYSTGGYSGSGGNGFTAFRIHFK